MLSLLISLSFILLLLGISFAASKRYVKEKPALEKWIFVWLSFDFLIHLFLEGPFVYMSIFGRQVETSSGFLASIWKEYGKADTRWLYSDPTVVSIEIITVVLAGFLSFAVLYALVNDLPSRHFLQVLLCTAELYGDWMTFAPEWLVGSPSLVTDNPMYLWVYLTLFNGLWVVIPLLLLMQSYKFLQNAVSQYGHKKLQ
ncbi:hypothetical protein K7432_000016 [Basidiobolus ranarum]|uniref:EXPERA domain-containing protein n=1 Tax=Basidiobolus ranarum TaxID=34480 RepID=A0ABR2WBW6_9FUNG